MNRKYPNLARVDQAVWRFWQDFREYEQRVIRDLAAREFLASIPGIAPREVEEPEAA